MKTFGQFAREAGPLGFSLGPVILALLALFFAWWLFNPVEEAADHVAVPVARELGIVASPADVRCLSGWTETTGKDPDGQIRLKVCTSPDKAIIVTIREGQPPVGFNGNLGRFLTDSEVAGLLR